MTNTLVEVYDVGGTRIRGTLVIRGRILGERLKEERTERNFLEQIVRMHESVSENHNPDALSILVPGPVDNGLLLKAPPLDRRDPIDIESYFGKLNENVYVDNDLNVSLLAELKFGAGNQFKNIYLLTISTGIGTGIALDGKPLKGTVGEFGHNVIERRPEFSFECGCGNNGCWASLSSGIGMENLYERLKGTKIKTQDIFNLAKEKDEIAKDVVKMARDYNAQGIGSMLNAISVDAIIIMGSIGLHGFDMIIPTKNEIKNYTVNKVPVISPTKLGDNIGLLGGYIMAAEK